jgi:hypothetical protein
MGKALNFYYYHGYCPRKNCKRELLFRGRFNTALQSVRNASHSAAPPIVLSTEILWMCLSIQNMVYIAEFLSFWAIDPAPQNMLYIFSRKIYINELCFMKKVTTLIINCKEITTFHSVILMYHTYVRFFWEIKEISVVFCLQL